MRYYSLTNILKKNAKYNMVFGERSNGKTYSVLELIIKNYLKHGRQGAIIRRWQEDFKGKRAATYFDSLVCNGNNENKIAELSGGKYDRIAYYSGRWFMANYDAKLNKVIPAAEPFCFAFSLTDNEHDKSAGSYRLVTTILFDEFMTRGMYLPDEFVLMCNCLSTIIRDRSDATIFMCANTVDMIGCPYLKEMGLKHVRQMKKGDIDVYQYGTSGLRVAVEYSDSPNKNGKPSDVYFAFDNDKLKMITGGDFELDFYPHITGHIKPENIIFSYFIIYEDAIIQADIVQTDKECFTHMHPKTTDIKAPEKDIIFTTEANPLNNHIGRLTKPINKAIRKLYMFFAADKVFYSDNETGEIVSKYLQWSNSMR